MQCAYVKTRTRRKVTKLYGANDEEWNLENNILRDTNLAETTSSNNRKKRIITVES